GMTASTLTGVARFRHCVYAGVSTFVVFLLLVLPLAVVLFRAGLAIGEIGLPTASENWMDHVLETASNNLPLVIALALVLVPVLMLGGFLLGGALDVSLTAVARAFFRRDQWTYHTREGKSFTVFGPWRNPVLAAAWSVIGWSLLLTCWVPLLTGS